MQKRDRPRRARYAGAQCGVVCMACYGRDGMAVAVEQSTPGRGMWYLVLSPGWAWVSSTVDFAHKRPAAGPQSPRPDHSSPLMGRGQRDRTL